MPQHPARHDTPTHQLHALANLQIEGEIAGDAHRLADLHVGAGPRMRVARSSSITASPQSPHWIRCEDPPVTTTSIESFGFSLSHAGEPTPGR